MMLEFDEPRPRLARLRIPALAAAAAALIVGWIVFNPPGLLDSPEPEAREPRGVTTIRIGDLSRTFEAEGTVAYEDVRTIFHPGPGTVTAVPSSGPIQVGDVLYAVDNVPRVVLAGDQPAWRTMGVEDVGADVQQLEEALVSMGYDTSGVLAVDGTFTDYTATLVELWQTDLGLEPTGTVELAHVLFVAEGTRVGAVDAVLGQAVPTDGVAVLSSEDRSLTFAVDVADVATLSRGDVVEVRLPDRSTLEATVHRLDAVGGGLFMASADLVGLDASRALPEEVPVNVEWTVPLGDELPLVPASAISRLDSGEYVVEVVGSSDLGTEMVAVEVGAQSGTQVEIVSDLPAGTEVIAP